MDAEKFYSPQELERQYNVRDSRADYETKIVADWINRSAITRTNLKSVIDISYGRGVGYTFTEHDLGAEIHKISATNIRKEMRQKGELEEK